MSQSLNKVNSGDPLRIPATAYNAFVEAALAHRQTQQNVAGGLKPGLPSNSLNLVKVRNDSGADAPQYSILGIGGCVFDPSSYGYAQWKTELVLSGVAVSNSAHGGGKFVICAQYIKAGMIGLCWASGVCPAIIQCDTESDPYATVDENWTAALRSSTSGPCYILWKESGTGTKYGVVRFGSGGGEGTVELFLITSIASNPMYGTHKNWNGLAWVNGPLGSYVNIRIHPQSSLDNYKAGYVWAVQKSGSWFATDMTNLPDAICQEE